MMKNLMGGWFEVQAYSTKERWEGREFHDQEMGGFGTLGEAVKAAESEMFILCYEVVVVAFGEHKDHQAGEIVFELKGRRAEQRQQPGSVQAADEALKAHQAALKLEGDKGTQLWHLLASFKVWAAANGVDFKMTVESVDKALDVDAGDEWVPTLAVDRKAEIRNELTLLAREAEQLKARGDSEPVGVGRTEYTDAVARNHVATVTMRRELDRIVRSESEKV